jgi:acetylornithine/N-succinyldiaminopimelate aminotransferase
MATNRQLFLKHLGQTSPEPIMLEIDKAEGVFMFGPDGKRYIDLISGVAVSNTGHHNAKVVEAVKNQVDKYMHLMVYGEIIQSPQVKYAERLAGLLPSTLNNCYFVNSGSEAVEGALKLAKRYTGKSRIISFRNAYHGSTHGALSVQGSEIYRNAFRPLLPDTFLADFNDEKSLSIIDESTACVIIEPVQGEAGVIYPENNFLQKVRNKCNSTGSLLIFDEIQTAFGRLGTMFAIERFGVVPDILLLAKALGGGLPLGAFISSSEIMSSLAENPILGHITTFGGHPVCCAAGLASLNVIIEERLDKMCCEKSTLFRRELTHPLIKEIRGEGLLMAIELTGREYVMTAFKNAPSFGILIDFFLFRESALRLAPPLTISDDEILKACRQIRKLLDFAMNNTCV